MRTDKAAGRCFECVFGIRGRNAVLAALKFAVFRLIRLIRLVTRLIARLVAEFVA